MKKVILILSLIQVAIASGIGITTVLNETYDLFEKFEHAARIYAFATILGITGLHTGFIGYAYPDRRKV